MREGMTDLILLIFLLGVVLGVAFTSLTPLMDNQKMGYSEELSDKSVLTTYKEVNEKEHDDSLNIYELLLTLQVQDDKMEFPRDIYIDGMGDASKVTIDGLYKNQLDVNTVLIHEKAKEKWGTLNSDMKFRFVYTFAGKSDSSGFHIDDKWLIKKVN